MVHCFLELRISYNDRMQYDNLARSGRRIPPDTDMKGGC